MKNKIYPCLWFDSNAREAAGFYCKVFNDSVILSDNQMATMFESSGQRFLCLNGGKEFSFNPLVSFYTVFDSEKELDLTWDKLIDGGSAMMPPGKYKWSSKYGWLQDRFGVSWQLTLGNVREFGQKFTPVLMYTGQQNGNAENAIRLYTSLFRDSSISVISRYQTGDNDIQGNINHGRFQINNQSFIAIDSSVYKDLQFNEAISLVVECEDQDEIDHFWYGLSLEGKEGRCGWLKDKFGFSWQIIPDILGTLMSDPIRSDRVVSAFLKMNKFEIDKLLKA